TINKCLILKLYSAAILEGFLESFHIIGVIHMFRVKIKNDERGLLFKDGNYIKCLQQGKHTLNPFIKYSVVRQDLNQPFDPADKNLNTYLEDAELQKELAILDLKDNELAIHFEDGNLTNVWNAGKYAFWNVLKKHEFIIVD